MQSLYQDVVHAAVSLLTRDIGMEFYLLLNNIMGVKELQSANEFQQLLQSNKFVAILFYRDGPLGMNPLPQLFSGVAAQFRDIALGQVNTDKHPWALEESKQQIPLRPPCLVAYRDGNVIHDSGNLDPVSAPGRISAFLNEVMAEE
ncbi:uncharacterized protein VTP21DRAFT_9627 [Calcarisporiella thermophila]|uniref:uncharacterized protein n=1 Tax=Calcarisporiella thermophila TaxID=911321 RepID=UPI003742A3B9